MQPTLHTAHAGSHTHTCTHRCTHTCTHSALRLSCLQFLTFFFFTLRCVGSFGFQLKAPCVMYRHLLSPSPQRHAHLSATLDFFFPSASRAASQCLSLNSFLPHSLWDSLFEAFLFSLFAFLFIEFHRFCLSNLWAFHSLFVLTSLFSCFWHLIDNSCCYFAAFLCCVIFTLLFPTLFCMSALNKLCYHLLTPTLPIL